MFNLEFLLTRKCNQKCYYCNNSTYCDSQVEVDLDYFRYILNMYYNLGVKNIRLELSGGEPGLVSNIGDLIALANSLDYVKKIFVLSNGTLRKRFGSVRRLVGKKLDSYHEHYALDIVDRDILYFDKDITPFNLENHTLSILILTDITLNSLLNNFDYFLEIGLFNRGADFKLFTPKVDPLSVDILEKTKIFYEKLFKVKNIPKSTFLHISKNYSCINRVIDPVKIGICARISDLQFIDLENKKIGQCSILVAQSPKYDVTEDNIKKALQGNLFTTSDFCKSCIRYADMDYYYFIRQVNCKRYINKGENEGNDS